MGADKSGDLILAEEDYAQEVRQDDSKVDSLLDEDDGESESHRLLAMLCQFFRQHSGRCTSKQLSTRFNLDHVDPMLFKQLLREVAKKDATGSWVLQPGY